MDTLKQVEDFEKQKKSVQNAQKLMKIQQNQVTRQSILQEIIQLGNAASEPASLETFNKYGDVARTKCLQIYQTLTNKNHPITKDPSTKNIEGFLAKDENKSPEEKHEVRLINSTLRELQSSEWERIRIQFENFEEGTDTKFFKLHLPRL